MVRAIVDDPLMMLAHGGVFSLSIPCTLDVPRAQRTSPFNIWRWVKWDGGPGGQWLELNTDPGRRGGAWKTRR